MNKINRLRTVVAGLVLSFAVPALAADYYWNPAVSDGNWEDASSWCTDAAGTTAAAKAPGSGDAAFFKGDNLASKTIVVNLSKSVTVSSVRLSGSNLDLTFKSTSTNVVLYGQYNATTLECTDSKIVFDTVCFKRNATTATLGGSGTTVEAKSANLVIGAPTIPAGCCLAISGASTVTASSLTCLGSVTVSGESVFGSSGAVTLTGANVSLSDDSHIVFAGNLTMTGGTRFSLDDSPAEVGGDVVFGSAAGGDHLVFSGANPVFRCTGVFFRGHQYNTHTDGSYLDFIVPEGGFTAAPLQCNTTNPFLTGTGAQYPIYLNVLASSPALAKAYNPTCPLVSSPTGLVSGNVDLTHASNAVATDQFTIGETAISVWKAAYRLALSVNKDGAGTVTPSSGDYAPGTEVTLTATAGTGYKFIRWTGDIGTCEASASSITVLMDQPRTIQAVFGTQYSVSTVENLTTALGAAVDGDEIVLASGEYALSQTLSVTKGILLRSATGEPEDVRFTGTVRLLELADANAEVQSVTFVGGNTTDKLTAPDGCGRAAYVTAGTLRNCVFRNLRKIPGAYARNHVATAIHLTGADALMTGCVVSNNAMAVTEVTTGLPGATTPGVYVDGGATVSYTLVAGNSDSCWYDSDFKFASGIVVNNGMADHCTVVRNTGFFIGGLSLLTANASAVKCAVEGNVSVKCHGDSDETDTTSLARFSKSSVGTGAPRALFADYDAGDYRAMPGSALETGDIGYAFVTGDAVKIGSANPTGFVGANIAFTAGVSGCTGAAQYRWTFGDGSDPVVTSTPAATHAYAAAGGYTVRVEVLGSGSTVLAADEKTNFVCIGVSAASVESVAGLRTALAAAVDGTVISVAKGAYALDASVVIDKAVTIRGATGDPNDVVFTPADNVPAFILDAAGARLESVRISGGSYTTYSAYLPEGGLAVSVLPGGGTVSNCVVRGNAMSTTPTARHRAAMVMATGTRAKVTHCTVRGNTASCESTTSGMGGTMNPGVALYEGASLENSLVANNVDTGRKASSLTNDFACGVYVEKGTLVNCTVAGNSSKWDVGGVNLKDGSAINTVVAGNASSQSQEGAGDCDNVLEKQTAKFTFSQIGGETETLFRSTGSWRPRTGSPLVDAGSSEGVSVPAVDLRGRPRVRGTAIDIGAFEEQGDGLLLLVR